MQGTKIKLKREVGTKKSSFEDTLRRDEKQNSNGRIPMKILRAIGKVAYELDLSVSWVSIHPVFHLSMLKYVGDPSLIVPIKDVGVTESLSYKEVLVAILDRQVRILRTKDVTSVKVFGRNQKMEEATWEAEEDMKVPVLVPRVG
ncbi:uncharacterized protein LOC124885674 [Capsicum annuum]|uniref:uncharacterized protein LOC124885674 n=1 Tax=Capsicum annuum TaxID=4072 RepID=UPI001FB0F5D2|nr:uncharacterized protein LOC124885674 [Capsicum annuum]